MTLDLFSIGSWTIFDHLMRMERLPQEGETLPLDMPIEEMERIHYGDCSANIAAAAAKLGLRTGLSMVVGDDFITSGYAKHLTGLGVDIAGVEVRSGERSGHSFNFFAGNRGFCVSHLGVARDQSGWTTPLREVKRAKAVVVSEAFTPYTLAAIEHARALGRLTAINGMVATAGTLAPRFLAAADVLFLSRGEAAALGEAFGCDSPADLLTHGPSTIVVTEGSRGSRWYVPGAETLVPAVATEAFVDSTGAGDSFVAGALYGLVRRWQFVEAGAFAATVASFVVEAWGCQTNLPSLEQAASRYRLAFGKDLPR
jgi:sugar/nucleoside kinase (ribokinase family)